MNNPITSTESCPLGNVVTIQRSTEHTNSPIELLQITDCHLGEKIGERLAGMDTDESLDLVIHSIKSRIEAGEALDLILATGDLANHESVAAYQRLQQKLSVIDAPSAWLPGNHDSYRVMLDSVGKAQAPKMVAIGNWRIIMLDSAVPGEVPGRLGEPQLQKLDQTLQEIESDAHIIVALHHQPIKVGSEWIDQQRVADGEAFIDTMSGDHRIKAVIWGHIHQEFEARDMRLASARLLATPSTCIQFEPKQSDFKLHDNSPGYRWFKLHDDGRLETGVERLQGIELAQDLNSRGY